jgi:hypothetical protein
LFNRLLNEPAERAPLGMEVVNLIDIGRHSAPR